MRRAFTLMELLIVMLIMSILAALALSALAGATEQAREARTRSIVTKIDQLIAAKWDEYQTKPVPISTSGGNPRVAAFARVLAVRDLMRMELPDRKSDVVRPPADYNPAGGTITSMKSPAARNAYIRRAMRATGSPDATLANWSEVSQGAECLYMIVSSMRDGDRNALDFFQPSEIGDMDGDGMKELLDAWGRPIEWLRWAPGFLPENGAVTMQTRQSFDPAANALMPNPDPFDQLKADPRWTMNPQGIDNPMKPFALYPLIFSGGRNKALDIFTDNTSGFHEYAPGGDNAAPDPWRQFASGFYAGQPMDADADGELTYGDNITNHYQEP